MDELNPLQPVKPLKKYSGEAGGEELSPERKRYVAFVVITAALTASSLGYDVGVMAGAMDGLEETFALSDFEIEVVIGAMNFVAAIGALFAGNTADRFGRKASLGICCFLYLVGGGLMTGAPNYASLLAGRIITGVGVGLAFVIGPVYISEITPPELRGVLATVFDVSINLGILSGYVASFVLENTLPDAPQSLKWRAMIGFGNVFPLVVSFLLIRLPESPRWLTMKGRRRDAEKVLSSILGIDEGNQQAIALSLAAIEEENKIDAESASWLEVISPPEPHVRHAVGVAFGIGFWQQITGTEAVLYYSANFLEEAGLTSTNLRLLGNMLVGLSKLLPEFWVMSSINSRGRRWHMILSAGSMTVSLALLGAAFGLGLPSWTVILFL
ncbi:putative polyol transporter 6 [Diplonema papillatum]|nr:putative polyol transporter 6 [Diplonema papillatum]|eukprot:gene18004-27724_t